MPQTSPATAETATLPEPIAPSDGALVDARAVAFEWSEARPGASYYLQIANDPEFDDVIATISAGETTAVTVYHTLDRSADCDLYWRVRAGEKGAWGPAANIHCAGEERISAELASRDEAARKQAQASLQRHLEGEHRMPVVLPDESDSDRLVALILGVIVVSFVILLIVLFIMGQITYPAEAVV